MGDGMIVSPESSTQWAQAFSPSPQLLRWANGLVPTQTSRYEFREKYIQEMRFSFQEKQSTWREALTKPSILLVCTCDGPFCHMEILAELLEKASRGKAKRITTPAADAVVEGPEGHGRTGTGQLLLVDVPVDSPISWISSKKIACIDFEGADSGDDSACSLAMVLLEGGEVKQRWSNLIRPPRSNIRLTHVHGITWEMVRKQPTFRDFAPRILEFLAQADCIAAHNVGYDKRMLQGCLVKNGYQAADKPFHCTMKMAQALWPENEGFGLDHLCQQFQIPLIHHQALSDALACAELVRVALGRRAIHAPPSLARAAG